MESHTAATSAHKANPRTTHVYSDEDLMGRIKRILEHCHGGTATVRVVQRYTVYVCVRWWILLHILRGVPFDEVKSD